MIVTTKEVANIAEIRLPKVIAYNSKQVPFHGADMHFFTFYSCKAAHKKYGPKFTKGKVTLTQEYTVCGHGHKK